MNETRELILNSLGVLAREYPEQRMGQIIYNYICSKCPNDDPFFISDEKLLEILERAFLMSSLINQEVVIYDKKNN